MLDERVAEQIEMLCPAGARLEPFAVLPDTAQVAERYGLSGLFPSQAVIRAVNTKSYSLRMRDRLGIENVGIMIGDVASLLERGSALLQHGPILEKDDYGVSGKGNLLIETHRTLQRITRHLSAQVAVGKRIGLILEPYLRKRADFSCQFRIDDDGQVTVISVQELINKGLAFGASCSADPALLDRLVKDDYFQLIEQMGALMYTDGYYGDVCVDSMILHEGELAPLVEINARKSMSLIKNAIDNHLKGTGRTACLTYVSAINEQSGDFTGLLELLDREGLLFSAERDTGIVPLTSRTMYPRPSSRYQGPARGRIYVAAVIEKPEQHAGLMAALARVMELAGLHVTQ
jgi:hypothetical protein